jgi:hypothetical protein
MLLRMASEIRQTPAPQDIDKIQQLTEPERCVHVCMYVWVCMVCTHVREVIHSYSYLYPHIYIHTYSKLHASLVAGDAKQTRSARGMLVQQGGLKVLCRLFDAGVDCVC